MRAPALTTYLALGGAGLFVPLALWLWLFGLPALHPPTSTNDTQSNFIALTTSQKAGSVWAWVASDRNVDPASHDTVVLTLTAESSTAASTSFVLGGPMLKYLHSCYGNGIRFDGKAVAYSQLSSAQRAAAVDYDRYSPADDTVATYEENQNEGSAQALKVARSHNYVRVTANAYASESRSFTPTSEPVRTSTLQYYIATCSFDPAAFWSAKNGNDVFTFPTTMVRAPFASSPTDAHLERKIAFADNSNYVVDPLGEAPDYSATGLVSFDHWWNAWDQTRIAPIVANQFAIVFTSESATASRNATLFWVGAVAAILGTLLISFGGLVLNILLFFGRRLRAGVT